MANPAGATERGRRRALIPPVRQCGGLLLVVLWLGGCAATGDHRLQVANLAPLQLPADVLTLADIDTRIQTPELLAVTDDMRAFVHRYTDGSLSDRQRLFSLHRAVRGGGVLDMQYDPFASGPASEVFRRGSANCLSYAHLFVALAREAGLDASYQWLEVRPQWTRMGERVAVRLHVNVMIEMRRGEQYMVDIDPLQNRDVTGARVISDDDARALYHSNIAMDALAEDNLELAWLHAVRALQLSSEMPHLWVNLGAIYRIAGQLEAAERSYFVALQLDPQDRSAMNNLVVLYERQGRAEERGYWLSRVDRYRERNPFYHAWLGDNAAEADDWGTALTHYQDALDLAPKDSHLLYATGIIHFQLGDLERAERYIGRAIEHASLRGEIEDYRVQLDEVRRRQLAET